MQFPENWPQTCPPDDSVFPEGEFFAAARDTPFLPQDFTSAKDRNAFIGCDECQRCGVSILKNLSDAESLLERFRRIYKYVARAELTVVHGKVKDTPTQAAASHCTIWPCQDVDLKKVFEVIS